MMYKAPKLQAPRRSLHLFFLTLSLKSSFLLGGRAFHHFLMLLKNKYLTLVNEHNAYQPYKYEGKL